MTVTGGTYQPTAAHIRYPIERDVLGYYETDDITLKPIPLWPGLYTTKTGQIVPCVYVEGSTLVPSTWKPSGIQCIITEVPDDSIIPGRGQIITVSTWKITFTNFGFLETTENTLTLREVQSRMGRLFTTANLRYMPRSEVALESLTARFRGTSISPILRP
jgi:hypothetical protein